MIRPGAYVSQVFLPAALGLVLVAQTAALSVFGPPVCILYGRIPANLNEIVGAASFLAENGGGEQRVEGVAVLGHYGMRCPTGQQLFGARVAARLSDPEPRVRARALTALATWGHRAAVYEPAIRARLTDSAQVVWAHAVEAQLVIRHSRFQSQDDRGCGRLRAESMAAAEAEAPSSIPPPSGPPDEP